MRHSSFLLFLAVFLSSSCSQDPELEVLEPDVVTQETGHRVPLETALAELGAVLQGIDGETRTFAPRIVKRVEVVKGANVLPETRSGEASDVGDLVYIANFADDEGYAILGADDRLAPVIAITEQGNITAEDFEAVANGDYDLTAGQVPPVFPDVAAYAMSRIGGGGGGTGGLGGFGNIGGSGGSWGGSINKPNIPGTPGGGLVNPGGFTPIKTYERCGEWQNVTLIGPFMPMRWGQKEGYYDFTPVHSGIHCPVGCVAVAIGQIIASNRYRHERNGQAEWEYGGNMVNWTPVFALFDEYKNPLKFNKFLTKDNKTEGAQMIRLFLAGIGAYDGLNIQYYLDGSSGTDYDAKMYLRRLGYENVHEQDYIPSLVDMMIRERRMPVYVSGRDNGGHAWIIDGILHQSRTVEKVMQITNKVMSTSKEDRVMFHNNFGWAGRCDGYYLPEIFNDPSNGPTFENMLEGDRGGIEDKIYKWNDLITYTGGW